MREEHHRGLGLVLLVEAVYATDGRLISMFVLCSTLAPLGHRALRGFWRVLLDCSRSSCFTTDSREYIVDRVRSCRRLLKRDSVIRDHDRFAWEIHLWLIKPVEESRRNGGAVMAKAFATFRSSEDMHLDTTV